jgi:hypothetical protein
MKTSIIDNLMAEPIHMPGFPQIIVTRHFLLHWLIGCGWSQRERGFASLDYMTFAPTVADEELTDEETRDRLLNQVRETYLRD